MAPLLDHHDRERFEVFVYPSQEEPAAWAQPVTVRSLGGLNDAAACALIRRLREREKAVAAFKRVGEKFVRRLVRAGEHVGEGGGVLPYDVFTLSFTAVRVTYSQSKFDNMPGGSTEFGWDLSTNLPA